MNKIGVLGILMASLCGAQPYAPTLAETDALNAAYRASLGAGIAPPGSPPSAGSVSVAQLEHRPPKKAQKSAERGARFSQAGDHRRAAEEFTKAVGADPDFASARRTLGEEYAWLGRYAEAVAGLQRSLTLDPESWIGHYNLGAVLYAAGDFPGAERSLRRALALSKTSVQVHTLLACVLWDRPETRAEAVEHLRYAARGSSEARELLDHLRDQ